MIHKSCRFSWISSRSSRASKGQRVFRGYVNADNLGLNQTGAGKKERFQDEDARTWLCLLDVPSTGLNERGWLMIMTRRNGGEQ